MASRAMPTSPDTPCGAHLATWRLRPIQAPRVLSLVLALALMLALLSGCAITRKIDSEVQSFVGAAKPLSNAHYRFERLPSQDAAAEQATFETMAVQALSKVGLTLANKASEEQARYAVQLGVQITRFQKAPASGLRWGGMGGTQADLSFGMRWITPPEYWYRHSVHIVLRELASNQVAFETSAQFDGPWDDAHNLLPVIMDAALQGYPQAVKGPRIVAIDLPPPSPP